MLLLRERLHNVLPAAAQVNCLITGDAAQNQHHQAENKVTPCHRVESGRNCEQHADNSKDNNKYSRIESGNSRVHFAKGDNLTGDPPKGNNNCHQGR